MLAILMVHFHVKHLPVQAQTTQNTLQQTTPVTGNVAKVNAATHKRRLCTRIHPKAHSKTERTNVHLLDVLDRPGQDHSNPNVYGARPFASLPLLLFVMPE
jgi:hypothetical protein